MKIGEKIRGLRLFRNYSQENMAEMLNISLASYGRIERGEVDCGMEKLEQIAKILSVNVTDILDFGDKVFNQLNHNNEKGNTYALNCNTHFNNLEEVYAEMDKLKIEIQNLKAMVQLLYEKLTINNSSNLPSRDI